MSAQVGISVLAFDGPSSRDTSHQRCRNPLDRMELTVPAVLSGVCRTDNFYQSAGEDDR